MTIGAIVTMVAGLIALLLRHLALRVVGTRPRHRPIEVKNVRGCSVMLRASPEASATGTYVLRFGQNLEHHVTLGEVLIRSGDAIVRPIGPTSAPLPEGSWPGILTGYPPVSAHPLKARIVDISIPTGNGTEMPAWYVPGQSDDWTIHVQGIRTTREVTLRSMELTAAASKPTLSIAYRGAGDAPTPNLSTLGQREWQDLHAAVEHARKQGAKTVTVIGWSMGAGIALELARRLPHALDGLILIAPATNWPQIIRHGATRAGLPRWVGSAVVRFLSTPAGAALSGLPEPLQMDKLSWSKPGDLTVPTAVIHSRGDAEIPYSLSEEFARAHGNTVKLIEFPSAPHAWEANADPDRFATSFSKFFESYLDIR